MITLQTLNGHIGLRCKLQALSIAGVGCLRGTGSPGVNLSAMHCIFNLHHEGGVHPSWLGVCGRGPGSVGV